MVLPIALATIAAVLIIKGFTGASLSDIINGNVSINDKLDGSDTNAVINSVPGIGNAVAIAPIAGQQLHASTHPTLGLAGYPAYDYMAPAGTPVISPVSGTVFKLSGKDPKLGGLPGGPLGYSIYIQAANSTKKYYLTHLDRVQVKLHQSVSQGQQIAVVANGPISWSRPHVHMGISIV